MKSDITQNLDFQPPAPSLASSGSYIFQENSADMAPSVEKFIFQDGLMKINTGYRRDVIGAPNPLPYDQQPLAVISSIDDITLACEVMARSTGYQLQLPMSFEEAMNILQDGDQAYMTPLNLIPEDLDSNLEAMATMLDDYDIPIGCMLKVLNTKDYHIHVIVDDSVLLNTQTTYSINFAHEILMKRHSNSQGNFITYWEYVESILHSLIDILSFVPVKSFQISFVSSQIKITRPSKPMKPSDLQEEMHCKLAETFLSITLNTTSRLYSALENSLLNATQQTDPTLHLVFTTGIVSGKTKEDVQTLVCSRSTPQKTPMVFLPLGFPENIQWIHQVFNI